jgi:hypothetical protein
LRTFPGDHAGKVFCLPSNDLRSLGGRLRHSNCVNVFTISIRQKMLFSKIFENPPASFRQDFQPFTKSPLFSCLDG